MTTLKRARIKSYTAGTHRATVQIAGSLSVWLEGIPVATDIAPTEVIAGRECAVLFFTDDNPDDAVMIAVYGAVPGVPTTGIRVEEDNSTVHASATAIDFTEGDAVLTTVSGSEVDVNLGLYALLGGRATPQTIHGGLALNDNLTLKGTAHVTPGSPKVVISGSDLQIGTAGKRFLDSSGTERLLFSTGAPHVRVTGDLHVDGNGSTQGSVWLDEMSTPGAPASNTGKLYAKDVGGVSRPHWLDDASVEHNLLAAAASHPENLITSPSDSEFIQADDGFITGAGAAFDWNGIVALGNGSTSGPLSVGSAGYGANAAYEVYVSQLSSTVNNRAGIIVEIGGQGAAPSGNTVIGVGGRAIARHSSAALAIGLDYLAGTLGRTVANAIGVRSQLLAIVSGGLGTITTGRAFYALTPQLVGGGAVTNVRGFECEAIASGTSRKPFVDNGSDDDDDDGNRFYSNTAFFTTGDSGLFGSGDGVMHIQNRRAAPSSNPSSGGILYVESGALKYRGSSGTVTTIANA
jgi:hypothetical protein